jgi:hypothetical protein
MASDGRPRDAWRATASDGRGRASPTRGRRPGGSGGSRKWLGAALLLAALGGAIAGLLVYLWPAPDPVLLAIPVSEYAHPDWPPNPWAEADARGVRDRFGLDSAQAFQVQEKARILRELRQAADDSRGVYRRRPVVVYLCALGVAADGKVFLVPGDGRPDDPSGWLPLGELLDQLPRDGAPLLLILDVRPAASPRSVLPAADVNEELDATLAKLDAAGDLPFHVLTANTPPEGPCVIRPLRRTAFGLALAQAAGGAADGWGPDRRKDGRVSVTELAAYVRETTHYVSVRYGHPPQLPRLHGKGRDFKVISVPGAGPAKLPEPADPEAYPDWLRKGWEERDAWAGKDRLDLRAPRLVRHLNLVAARAESRWLAGRDAEAVRAQFQPVADELREAAKGLASPAPLVRTVARVRRDPRIDVRAAEAALRPVFDKVRTPAPAAADDPKGPKDDGSKAAMATAWGKPPDAPPHDATAAALFGFALELREPSQRQLQLLAEFTRGFKPRPRHAELLALDLVAAVPPERVGRWKAGTVRALLEATRAAEEAVACDGRCLPWVRGRVEEADKVRREAVAVLCDAASPDEAMWEAGGRLERVVRDYAEVRAAAAELERAFGECEETRAVLADLGVTFPDELAPVPEAVATAWAALAEDFRQLRVLLRPPDQPGLPSPHELRRATDSTAANRVRLRSLVRVPDGATPRQLERALGWPWWTHGERGDLHRRLDAAGREAAGRVLAGWPGAPSGQEPAAPPRASARVAADSARYARRVIDLVRLADGPDAADLAARAARLGPAPGPPELAELTRPARAAWREKLPAEYRRMDPAAQAAAGWAVDPDDVPATARGGPAANPELPDRRRREKEFHDWLGGRLRAEAAAARALKLQTAPELAAALHALGSDFLEWSP